MSKPCLNCEGAGKVLLLNSWFTADGYRRERCGICGGSGVNPPGYTQWPGHAQFLAEAHARIAKWGGMKPSSRRMISASMDAELDGRKR